MCERALARRREKLGPGFHCATCIRPEKDLAQGCPKCELTEAVDSNRETVIYETAYRFGKRDNVWPFKDWPLDRVMGVYYHVTGLLAGNEGRISVNWFEDVAAIARVILDERAQSSFVDRWESPT